MASLQKEHSQIDPSLAQQTWQHAYQMNPLPGPRFINNHTIPPTGYVCKICKVPGHWIQNCLDPANTRNHQKPDPRPASIPPSTYVCKICGIPGHWIQQCPQGSNATRPPMPPQGFPNPVGTAAWARPGVSRLGAFPPRRFPTTNIPPYGAFTGQTPTNSYPPNFSAITSGAPSNWAAPITPTAAPGFTLSTDGAPYRPIFAGNDPRGPRSFSTEQPLPVSFVHGIDDDCTLWMGDLEPWMTDKYLTQLFLAHGEKVSVKVMPDKTGRTASYGYGFIRFSSPSAALRALKSLNGRLIPNTDRTFRLNRAVRKGTMVDGGFSSIQSIGVSLNGIPAAHRLAAIPIGSNNGGAEQQGEENGPLGEQIEDGSMVFSIFVGNLSSDVDQNTLISMFSEKYSSVRGGRVVLNRSTQNSKGFGFIIFADRDEAARAMTEMQGHLYNDRPLRISPAKRRIQ